ncbi:OLC1v1028952C1 [Oldenlandia corymbosa var. corymbosa]|uniref:OLC1v1028952C1 n=1 Tax=Oldenlandia corymbosa var. corymbosa TaxID=529605 RepID=A0AAV1CEM0_OLDCO|nr:OLC1v1028952C1 [Oldenlandia corymbosa var. corymbosa]
MGEAIEKWSVTYTKHIKQKRKVYQDGVLELHPSRNKVILYDDCETPLESRFVKKDDTFAPGQTLEFASFLVDIGELFGGGVDKKPVSKVYQFQKDSYINRKHEAFHTPKASNDTEICSKLGQTKATPINISPSRKLIREYKKNEMTKFGSSPGCPETTKSSKKDEIIKSGDSIQFEGYLVDIGEPKQDDKAPVELKFEEKVHHVVGKKQGSRGQLHPNTRFPAGTTQKDVPLKNAKSNVTSSISQINICAPGASKMLVRPAHEILSLFRKSKSQNDSSTTENFSNAELHAPQSSSFFQKENMQDAYDAGSKHMDTDEEKARKPETHEISKCKDMEQVLSDEIAESDKTGFKPASSFFVKKCEEGPGLEPKSLATLEKGLKSRNVAVLLDRASEYLECGNRAGLVSGREKPTEGAPPVLGLEMHQFSMKQELQNASQPRGASKEIGGRWLNGDQVIAAATNGESDSRIISKQNLETKKRDDVPSFDLGF